MRRCARAPQPRRLHFVFVQNFQSKLLEHFASERLPARIPPDLLWRLPSPRLRNSPLPSRSFVHQQPAAPAPPEWAASRRERYSRRRSRSTTTPALRQFLVSEQCTAPGFSGAVEERAAMPPAFAICELFPSREYIRSYHTHLQPLNGFAPLL